ncbi:asparagine synthase (glutamine-hydrolyzing) [Streptomyces albus]|uniref:asparagine synthase (glutamine-hydrolyzing) n=1 Tax=Streptomyces albus TaxID=1888 RepID=L7PIM7_9ACTN|nr:MULTISPECIES: asparagine synthase (glutamine-hydrolyzing) [Streptomyces]AFW04589.1 asparagine synthase [Streptomyces albus]EPD96988.1 asparagine synthase (glutamine-hydrolyzing) [Streptomyces sp. HPH0547]QID34748.1 asparagine synthase (glutamine-hydrolyzing) [Streptomyces albus]TGG74772.1 asparagine synthase (glutamine-hydrolyzing) [Streptomyces albus]UVN58445.1 asparagine synthase (glutamine-hydrolyzing) [Streptomyces albus]
MCRIYGHFNAVVPSDDLARVGKLQLHGGPDWQGCAIGPTWSLGSNRLAVMDPAGGRQPYRPASGAVHVVLNGEIYNHNELRNSLGASGYRFTDRCDGSVLPALYELYGDAFVDHLDGMYAIAVLDLRAEPRLVLATDHLGMKPLFYHWDERRGALYFSSEIPALLAFPQVPADRWTPGLDAYLATRTPFGERTMFRDVSVLPPAVTAVCDLSRGLRVGRRSPGASHAGHRDGEVRDVLRQEVDALLEADVPVASITSGGLDSSLVTTLATGKVPELHTFNIAYTGTWPDDERHFARAVSDHAGARYHQVELDPVRLPELLPHVVRHLGQPNADPITVSSYALFAAVREAGFTVALTGDGADEAFGGYRRMRNAAEAAAAGKPWYEDYLDELAVLPARLRGRLYTADYAAALGAAPAIPQEATGILRSGPGSVLDRITSFELGYRLPAYHLRRVDHLSMASAVEVRLPFCQQSVVRQALRLPDRSRIHGGAVKRALYGAARGVLPDAVLAREKQPFTLPVSAMLAPGWPLWDYARDLLAAGRLRQAGEIDPRAVERLFARQAARPDGTTALTLWALLVYEIWREQFGSAPPPAPYREHKVVVS